jgi:hypothetical protein
MTAATLALQKALYARLRAEPALAALLGDPPRVFDAPPGTAPFPYVVIGETRAAPIAGHDSGVEHDIRIEIFSRHVGRFEVKRIVDLLFAALHGADFALDGARLVNCRFVFADVYRAEEGELYRGLARFRCVTEAT